MLELNGKEGRITLIDGSPQFINKVAVQVLPDNTEEKIQSTILLTCIRLLFPDEFHVISQKVFDNKTWESRLKTFVEFAHTRSNYSMEYGSKMLTALIKRMNISLNLEAMSLSQLKNTPISLIRPTESSIRDFDEDYGLGKYCLQEVKVKIIDGNHTTILSNAELIRLLNAC